MREMPLPPELHNKWGHLPDLTYRGSNEWSSACPQCGGAGQRHDKSDRFRLFAGDSQNGARGWCRRCGYFAWADDNKSMPSKEEREKAEAERVRLSRLETERIQQKIEQLREAAYWEGYHDAMQYAQRELWRKEGIRDELQDYFRLGHTSNKVFYHGATPFRSNAMTIPFFDVNWQAVNVQYRLLSPPDGVGKYRFTYGLPTPLFLTNPYEKPSGATLLVEGAKKAMVVFDHIDEYCIVALPSKMPPKALYQQLENCEPIFIALDPDAYYANGGKSAIHQVVKNLGKERCRIVKMLVKPDDFFTEYGGSTDDLMGYIRQAVKA